MTFSTLENLTSIKLVMALRSASIVIQTTLVLFVTLALGYDLPVLALMLVIAAELVFNIYWYVFYKLGKPERKSHLLLQLVADVIFLGCLLYFSGGATNAFVSLLLIPIAIAAVSLSIRGLGFVALIAAAMYSFLLWLMPMHVMHGNMEAHFIGMWLNFLFSAAVVSIVVYKMAGIIHQREQTIARYREEQLKQERIVALGVASAQVTHDLATPIASMRLLMDELKEEQEYEPDLVEDIDQQLIRCSDNLHAFRQMTDDIKQNKKVFYNINTLFNLVIRHCQLNYPHIDFRFTQSDDSGELIADSSLIPAIVNVINNAVIASTELESKQVDIDSSISNNSWKLSIKDFGKGFNALQFSQLGTLPQPSEQGLGVAIMLSNASLERLGGKLALMNHETGGAQVILTVPLADNRQGITS